MRVPFFGLLVVAFTLAACSSSTLPDPGDGPRGAPLVTGPVASISHSATASGMLVEAGPGSNEACGIQATVDAETRYFRRADEGPLVALGVGAAGLGQIEVGDTVEVYVDGPVAESCPVQGRASALVLLAEAGS